MPDHSRVYVNRAGNGYVERPFTARGTTFVSRTYAVNHVTYTQVYRPYAYHSVTLAIYTPRVYYSPAFYGWAYRPWATPIVFSWGWGASPWFGFYRPYFVPYATYIGPSPWLTDYLVSQSLAGAYQAQVDAARLNGGPGDPGAPPPGAPLSPQVKDYINQEVQRQLSLANFEASNQGNQGPGPDPGSSGLPRLLGDGQEHTFVAGGDLAVIDNTGLECSLTEGDALHFTPPPPGTGSPSMDLQVLWSKGNECRIGSTVTVALNDVQEMYNHMRATVDRGLAELRAQQGKNGIPPLPPNANTPPTQATFAPLAPPPDPNAANTIQAQLGAADQEEANALSQAGNPAP
jgi:hypothetical protein